MSVSVDGVLDLFEVSFVPTETASVWLTPGDPTVNPTRAAAENVAVIHYHRPDGEFGDPTSTDFNDFWGLHVWTGATTPTEWPEPLRPVGFDSFGAVFRVPLGGDADQLAYILHRGDTKDPGPDQFLRVGELSHEVWQVQDADPGDPYVAPRPSP